MRKITITYFFLISVLGFTTSAQENVPFSLKLFLENYANFVDGYIEQDEFNINYFSVNGSDYFVNVTDTLLWPDNFELLDNFYKHRLGLNEFYRTFKSYKDYSSDDYYYGYSEFDQISLIKSNSKKYFDKYRIYATENQIFHNNNFFGKDSIVAFSNFYDIISWFNPNTEKYEWRINKIYENKAKSWLMPQSLNAQVNYLIPSIKVDGIDINQTFGFGAGVKANWILGGKNYFNYSFVSGLNFSYFSFDASKAEINKHGPGLLDKDNYPFTLISNLNVFKQTLSFQMISVPLHLKFNSYLKNKKQSVGIYGGLNFHFPVNAKSDNKSGDITYSGKYKFDFSNDSILLDNLENYGFNTFNKNDFQNVELKLNNLFISIEAGAEFNWYLGKKWAASFSAGYMKSVTPIYGTKNKVITYNIENGKYGGFEPQLNSFLTLNNESFLSSASFGIGISYLIDKPVIPHGRVGYRNGEIGKLVKTRLVSGRTSFSQNNKQKIVTLFVSDISAGKAGSRINYRYIGPTPKHYKRGKLNEGAKKGNKLSLLVPSSNAGAQLFLEEPYGYNLEPKDIDYSVGGMYGEIKKLSAADIWEGDDNQRNINVSFNRLPAMNIFLLSYKYSFDNSGIIRKSTIDRIKQAIINSIDNKEIVFVYVTSDEPRAWQIKNQTELDKYITEIELKLTNTDKISANINGLKNFLSENNVNPRRDILIDLSISEEFLDFGKTMFEEFAKTLNIDNDFVDYSTTIHSYGKMQSLDYESSLEYLRNVGKVKQ